MVNTVLHRAPKGKEKSEQFITEIQFFGNHTDIFQSL